MAFDLVREVFDYNLWFLCICAKQQNKLNCNMDMTIEL